MILFLYHLYSYVQCFFFFKQKTAYEMRISDWSSDVCSSDLRLQVARDITERRRHEDASRVQQEKIQLTSRLTTMGEMASSLAHELNQPLTAISNYSMGAVAMLKAGTAEPEKLLAALEKAASQAERAGKIISRIREFVKRSEPRRQRVAISRIVDNALGFADIDARKRPIAIQPHFPET